MKFVLKRLLLSFALLFSISSCDLFRADVDDGESDEVPQRNITSQISLPSQSSLSGDELQIISSLDSEPTETESEVELNTVQGNKQQILIATSESDNPVLLSVLSDTTKGSNSVMTPTSTAKSLILMNPFFIGTSSSQRDFILKEAENHGQFDDLVDDIETLLIKDPENTLNYQVHPGIYRTAASIAIDILGGSDQIKSYAETKSEAPWIEDVADDPAVTFFNPRTIYYGVGIDNTSDEDVNNVISLSAQASHFSYEFDWPPIVRTDPTEKEYDLGDGQFEVEMVTGFDFSSNDVYQWSTPNGRATWSNVGKGILLMVDLVVGISTIPDASMSRLVPQSTEIRAITIQMGTHLAEKDATNFFIDLLELINAHSEAILLWLWEDATTDAARSYITQIHKVLGNVNTAVKVITTAESGLNRALPFATDLIKAKNSTSITLIQENGNLTDNLINEAPEKPTLNVGKRNVTVGEEIQITTASTDPDGETVSYRINWGNGQYGQWSDFLPSGSNYTASHVYQEEGDITISTKARDESGGISELSEPLNVNVYPENVVFADDFETDQVGQLPSNPPWTSEYQAPSYLQIEQEEFSTNLFSAFYDSDPVLDPDSAGAYAQIYTGLDSQDEGTLEFSWKIAGEDDHFGVRVWDSEFAEPWSDHMGYYVLFYEGEISYYDGSNFHKITDTEPDTWYDIKLAYNVNDHSYDIYINGTLELQDVGFVGNPRSLQLLQVVAFSDAACETGFIDNIRLTGATTTDLIVGEDKLESVEVTSMVE